MDDNLQTESLTILANNWAGQPTLDFSTDERTIDEGSLVYTTHPVFQEYEMHQDIPDTSRTTQTDMEEDWDGDGISDKDIHGNEITGNGPDLLDRDVGLCVESDNAGGDCGYFIEGWMGEKYVAIDGNADKLCKLLVEFEDDEYMILFTGKKWDLGGGFALELMGIDDDGDAAMLQLSKNNVSLYIDYVSVGGSCSQDRVYTYCEDVAGEKNIPIFSCYVDAVFKGDVSSTLSD